jgi:hypothetical protein
LTEELLALGHHVTLFASGDSCTSAKLEALWPRALRLDGSIRDPNALHMAMLEQVRQRANEFGAGAPRPFRGRRGRRPSVKKAGRRTPR